MTELFWLFLGIGLFGFLVFVGLGLMAWLTAKADNQPTRVVETTETVTTAEGDEDSKEAR